MPIDPIAQKMLDDAKASGRPNAHLLPVPTARENFENTFAALQKPDVHRVTDVAIETRDGAVIPGRLYVPAEGDDLPLTVYYHGGGWLLGSVDSHDAATRLLAKASGSAVLSVGYRLAPESRSPPPSTTRSMPWNGRARSARRSESTPRASRSRVTAPVATWPPPSRCTTATPGNR